MMMQSNSRIVNTSRNMFFALLSQIVSIGLNLISRAIFVRVLAAEYVGLSGLFTNILGLLAMAELGVGSAITYSLYKPIKENDYDKIRSLMKLYKQLYIIIGSFIFVVGCSLTPFIDEFIKERPNVPHLELIFMLFVLQSSISYFFSYKTQYLSATQNDYILQKFRIYFTGSQICTQIVYLFVFREYLGFLIIGILFQFLNNVVASNYVSRKFLYLKGESKPLNKNDILEIKKNVFALFLYKVAQRLSSTIDTIILSRFVGIYEVAIYFNYHLILDYSDVFFTQIIGKITPSLGNLMVGDDNKAKLKIFNTLQSIHYFLGTYLAVCLLVLFNPFIKLWLGENYCFSQDIVVALALSATITNYQRPCSLVRDAAGLFWYGRYRPVASALINVILSIVLVREMGTIGVVVGTILSKLLTYTWYDPYIVFKYAIKGSLKKYFFKYFCNCCYLLCLTLVCSYLYLLADIDGILGIVFGFAECTILVLGFYYILYHKTDEYNYIKNNVLVKILKK